ncbi:hypothetical protein SKAU_G00075880 [Synaphobranchus kaupii]|uniref:PDEase domain-containing protein n=1 Tax=Synaphobranchus kaupii TaxID=118154 RepID=A0A9Q1G8L8_SYNKA|nr:hypothetical protein SKAU_G00075880 [Synaphobranchus kaupii]
MEFCRIYEVTNRSNFEKGDFLFALRELRALVVEMVLATDMSCHFQQIKAMKSFLQQPEGIDKPKALSLLLHTADISHPAKNWHLHHRWTSSLLEEFFQQGDKESDLGLPFSPLCDRKSTMVAQSQIGFIDFIVEPTFTVLSDMTEKIVSPLIEEASRSDLAVFRRSSLNNATPSDGKRSSVKSTGSEGSTSLHCSLHSVDFRSFKASWNEEVQKNRDKWKTQATKDLEEKAKKDAEDKKAQEEAEGTKAQEEEEGTKAQEEAEGTKTTDAEQAKPSQADESSKADKPSQSNEPSQADEPSQSDKPSQAEAGQKDPVEQQPKVEEGDKDPGGRESQPKSTPKNGAATPNAPNAESRQRERNGSEEDRKSNHSNSPPPLAVLAAASTSHTN